MLCGTCQQLLQTHLSSTPKTPFSRSTGSQRHNHQASLDDLKASASLSCYICDTLWRRFQAAAKTERRQAIPPLEIECFSRCSFPKLPHESTPRIVFYIQKGHYDSEFFLEARLTLLFRLTDVSDEDIALSAPSETGRVDQVPTARPRSSRWKTLPGIWKRKGREKDHRSGDSEPLSDQADVSVSNDSAAFVRTRSSSDSNQLTPPVMGSTGSDASLACAREWLQSCLEDHVACGRTYEGYGLRQRPARLLQIDEPTLDMARVINVDSMDKEDIQYITLSHCWGTEDFLTLKTSTADRLHLGISVSELPRTFRDAVIIVRKLKMKLLWVDSLCILQDSKDDWRTESSKMADIYSGSTCNVAASAAPNAFAGCFFDRDESFVRPCTVKSVGFLQMKRASFQIYDTQMFNEDFKTGPLRSRGWVMQEVLLAPRVLYFHRRQIWWECPGLLACEMYPLGLPAGVTIDTAHKGLSRIKSWRTAAALERRSEDFNEGLWEKVIEDYSACDLTRSEDKLIALSGIAKVMRDILEDEYIVGLWKGRLDSQLLWQRPPNGPYLERPAQYRAPSWSWASVNGKIVPGSRNSTATKQDATLIKVLDIQLQAPTADLTGQITSGLLRLSGPLLTMSIRKDGELTGRWKSSEYTGSVYNWSTKSWEAHQIVPRFDTSDDDVDTEKRTYYILQVRKWHYVCECLLLDRCEAESFRRCGVLSISHELANKCRPPRRGIRAGIRDDERHEAETAKLDSLERYGKDYIITIV